MISDNNKVVEGVKPVEVAPKTEKELVDAFIKDIEAVFEKHQMKLVNTPVYKLRDDGSFSTLIQTSVGKLPQQ